MVLVWPDHSTWNEAFALLGDAIVFALNNESKTVTKGEVGD